MLTSGPAGEAGGGALSVPGLDHTRHLSISGTFSLDGEDFEVENNVWIVGGGVEPGSRPEVIIIDAPHSAAAIAAAVRDMRVVAIVATHGHNDHINAAVELRETVGAPILLHRADLPLWRDVYGDALPDGDLEDGMVLAAGEVSLSVLHTPGHTPGGCCLYDADRGVVYSGDTLFRGGPGATGRSWSDFPTIIESIRNRLLVLPPDTRVLTGHGDWTMIGDEAPHLEEWIVRGH
ncbi:MAG: MBL fold metallo-hydrolase [Acidimicrobiales bacterium]|jgi:glyoxylase-like metal-dependent hydrolase (beta-lactamase superfamily II)